jgi:glutathione S-transferase
MKDSEVKSQACASRQHADCDQSDCDCECHSTPYLGDDLLKAKTELEERDRRLEAENARLRYALAEVEARLSRDPYLTGQAKMENGLKKLKERNEKRIR